MKRVLSLIVVASLFASFAAIAAEVKECDCKVGDDSARSAESSSAASSSAAGSSAQSGVIR